MAYDDDEDIGGDPVELFKFIGPGTAWYLTSDTAAHTYASNSYTPTAIVASELPSNGTADPEALVVRIPGDHAIALAYGYGSPPSSLTLTVYRKQTGGDVRQLWHGSVPNVSPDGDWCELRSPSILGDRLEVDAPRNGFQGQCNNRVYDSICRVAKSAPYVTSTTVSSISTDGLTVTVAGVGGNPDAWFARGDITRATDGESRMIVAQVGAVLTLQAPFRTLAASDSVTMAAGCDGWNGTCASKFSNIANHTGTPFVPTVRLFHNLLRR